MFNIEDEVIIIKDSTGYCPYSWTTVGSKGFIKKISSNESEYLIEFYYFTSNYSTKKDSFWIDPKYIKVLAPVISNPHDLKYAKIITKMKKMEAKRKELGYKTYGTL